MLTDEEQDDGFYYKYNEKVLFRTDSKTQMEYLKNGVSGSIMKPNEARRKLDLPDGEGGDTLLANGSIVPLTMAEHQRNSHKGHCRCGACGTGEQEQCSRGRETENRGRKAGYSCRPRHVWNLRKRGHDS